MTSSSRTRLFPTRSTLGGSSRKGTDRVSGCCSRIAMVLTPEKERSFLPVYSICEGNETQNFSLDARPGRRVAILKGTTPARQSPKAGKRQGMGMLRLMVDTDLLAVWLIRDGLTGKQRGRTCFRGPLGLKDSFYRRRAAKAWHPARAA